MKKDAYYFSHDANSQDDPKCMMLIDQLGMEGYGIFWALIEKLRAEKNYILPLSILPLLALRWKTSAEKIEVVVKKYDLFKFRGSFFFSVRLKKSMEEKTALARLSASKRWSDANALPPHSERNANGMRFNAIKGKEKKVKKKNTISPSANKQPELDHNGNPVRSLKGMVF
jgi:hypothetical protein